jgi:uncharacterized protein
MSSAPPGFTAPAAPHPAPPLERPELPDGAGLTPVGPHWKAWTAWVALVAGFAAAIGGAIVLGLASIAFGGALDAPGPVVNILATVVQDLCLVGAAVFMARLAGRPRPSDFGLRPTRLWPAVGWGLATWVSFLLFTAAFVAIIGQHGGDDKLPKELGADDSTVALICVALLVCVIAPLSEEFFFRGYFFTALRSWRGVWPAAIVTGLVFGVIHAGSSNLAFLVPLGFFGFLLCLLYVRTGSLYPCIAVHSLNNCTAFGVSQGWNAGEIVLTVAGAYAILAGILLLVRVISAPRVVAAA